VKEKDYNQVSLAEAIEDIRNIVLDMSCFCQVAHDGIKEQSESQMPDVYAYAKVAEYVKDQLYGVADILFVIDDRIELYERMAAPVLDATSALYFPVDLKRELQPHIDRARQQGWTGWPRPKAADRPAARRGAPQRAAAETA
jgi:hypothetical protein